MFLRSQSWCFTIETFGTRLSSKEERLATEAIKGEGKYMYGKLKTWKECIKTNFHDEDVPYDMYHNVTAVLKIDSVYKQSQNYHPQMCIEECKYTDAESQQCSILSDSDNDGYFEV